MWNSFCVADADTAVLCSLAGAAEQNLGRQILRNTFSGPKIWGKTVEIAEDWLQRFRMEGGAKKHPGVGGSGLKC